MPFLLRTCGLEGKTLSLCHLLSTFTLNGSASERGQNRIKMNPKEMETPRKCGERSRRHPDAGW